MRAPRIALAVFLVGIAAGGSTAFSQTSSAGSIAAFEADADVYAVGNIALVTEVVGLPVEVYANRARASMDSGPRATALAGPADVPLSAAFGLLGIPVELPTSCQAFYPGTPVVDCGAQPGDAPGSIVGVGSGHAEANGDPEDINATAASATAASSSVKSPLYRIGAGQSTASTGIDDGRLTARSALKASDIRLAGGALELNGVSSYARAETAGRRDDAAVSAALGVTDGSIAGVVPFTVNDKGIVFKFPNLPPVPVAGVAIPLPPGDQTIPGPVGAALRAALAPVSAQLAPLGLEMKVVPGEETISEDGTTVHALSAALQVTFRLPKSADRVTEEIGRARADAYLTLASDEAGSANASDTTAAIGSGDGASLEGAGVAARPGPKDDFTSSAPSAPKVDAAVERPMRIGAHTPDLLGRARTAYLAAAAAIALISVGFVSFGPASRTMFSEARRKRSHGS